MFNTACSQFNQTAVELDRFLLNLLARAREGVTAEFPFLFRCM